MPNKSESPDLARQQQISDVLTAAGRHADSPEELVVLLELALAEVRRKAIKPEPGIVEPIPEIREQWNATSFPLSVLRTGGDRPTQERIGSVFGQQVERKVFVANKIVIQGVIWRRELESLATKLKFSELLGERIRDYNADHFFVDLEYIPTIEQTAGQKPQIKAPFNIYEDTEQELGSCEFPEMEKAPANLDIVFDAKVNPLKLTIRAS